MYVTENVAGRMEAERELAMAEKMIRNGADNEDVFDETGWFVGPDGAMRARVSDESFELTGELEEQGSTTIGEAIKHDEIFDIMPEAQHAQIIHNPDAEFRGEYYPGQQIIQVQDANDEKAIAHEFQHLLQELGDAPQQSRGANGNEDDYMENFGEIEAWDVMDDLGKSEDSLDTPDLLDVADEQGTSQRPSMGMGM